MDTAKNPCSSVSWSCCAMRLRSASRSSTAVVDPATRVLGRNAQTPVSPPIPAKSLPEFVREDIRPLILIAISPQYDFLAATISFRTNPLANIGWTIFQLDAQRRAARQELHGVAGRPALCLANRARCPH